MPSSSTYHSPMSILIAGSTDGLLSLRTGRPLRAWRKRSHASSMIAALVSVAMTIPIPQSNLKSAPIVAVRWRGLGTIRTICLFVICFVTQLIPARTRYPGGGGFGARQPNSLIRDVHPGALASVSKAAVTRGKRPTLWGSLRRRNLLIFL